MKTRTTSAAPRIGLLFDQDYDALAHARLAAHARFDRLGHDIGTAAGRVRLARFDFERFADAAARKARKRGWTAVVSHQEFQGVLAASLIAERCGLPGTPPESILACHHKLHARKVLRQVCPEANAGFHVLDPNPERLPQGLAFPAHVKPVRGTFSIMAAPVENEEACRRHLRLGPIGRWSMNLLLEPFDRLVARRLPDAGSSRRFLAEEVLQGTQHNLDGWMDDHGGHLLGIVDAHFYPGTRAFQRWQYPSALPSSVKQAAFDVAVRFLRAVGFSRGFFNMEFFHDPTQSRLTVLEFNPRFASQFGDLYRLVDGVDPHHMAIALALGEDPRRLPRLVPTAGVAASLVWRSFGTAPPPLPGRSKRASLAAAFPCATLMTYPHSLSLLARGPRWLESHRYGVINLGAADPEDLARDALRAASLLGWPNAPYQTSAP